MMTLTDGADLAAIIGVAVAIATLSYSLFVYGRRTLLDRVKHFASLKKEFLTDEALFRITELLEEERRRSELTAKDATSIPSQDKWQEEWQKVKSQDKWHYIYFFEQVALLLRARLIRKELAYYMFGYYAVLCAHSRFFWSSDFPREEQYWLVFVNFVQEMQDVMKSRRENPIAFVKGVRA